jgi:hypothetical protein
MVEVNAFDELKIRYRDDREEILESSGRLGEDSDALVKHRPALTMDLLVNQMETTDGEFPTCLHSFEEIELSKHLARPYTPDWSVFVILTVFELIDGQGMRINDSVIRISGHELNHPRGVVVVMVYFIS